MSEDYENANHLVLNLYRDGYSIAVKLNEFPVFTSETILETPKIAYEETSLLDYIENEELPPLLIEMIDSSPKLSKYKIWHNGCLILEVRDKTNMNQPTYLDKPSSRSVSNQRISNKGQQDYSRGNDLDFLWSSYLEHKQATTAASKRYQNDKATANNLSANNKPVKTIDSFFILLKPTNLSMLNDVLNLTESKSWSTQDRLQLESQIVLLNSPSLFLEPDAKKQLPEDNLQSSTSMSVSNSYLHRKRRLTHTRLANIYPKKVVSNNNNGASRLNSTNKPQQGDSLETLPPELILQQFIASKRAKNKTSTLDHLARFRRYKKDLNPTSST